MCVVVVFLRGSHVLMLYSFVIKIRVIAYCEKVYERNGNNLFWSVNNSGEILNK